MDTKICSKCKTKFPNTSDYFNKAGNRLNSRCKQCTKEDYKIWLEKNRERKNQQTAEWISSHREQLKEQRKIKYQENREEKIEYRKEHYDAEKARIYNKQYYEKNKTKYRDKGLKWRMLNKSKVLEYKKQEYIRDKEKIKLKSSIYRAMERGNSFTKDVITLEQWNSAKSYFNGCCAYCGKPSLKLSKEHYIPVSKGGTHTVENILPVCLKCNASKRDSDFLQWYEKQSFYNEETIRTIQEYFKQLQK